MPGCTRQNNGLAGLSNGVISPETGGHPINQSVVKSVADAPTDQPVHHPKQQQEQVQHDHKNQESAHTEAAASKTTGPKTAYLTFDDGPNSDYTDKVLDILRQKHIKATFMVVGTNIEQNPGVLERIIAEGNGISNHTFSHNYKKIYQSPDVFISDLDKNNTVIEKYTGKPVMLFRAPGGPSKLNSTFMNKIKDRGYVSVGWNISSADNDIHGVTADQIFTNIKNDLARVERLKLTPIILMHDGTQLSTTHTDSNSRLAMYIKSRESTLEALPLVIDYFFEKGYHFAVVDENIPSAW